MRLFKYSIFVILLALLGCSGQSDSTTNLALSDSDGGLTLPGGFEAVVVADSVGPARHITAAENGDLYVSLSEPQNGHGIAAVRDEDGDGQAEVVEYFGNHTGTGIHLQNGYLYSSSDTSIVRYEMSENQLVPQGEPEKIISGFPKQNSHAAKSFTFDNSGNLYVNVGAPSNACQQDATGIRNIVALTWNDQTNALYGVQHGRDQLRSLWPDLYTEEENASQPAEEFFQVNEGDNFGWPYTYYNWKTNEKMVAPEYGGNGEKQAEDGRTL